MIVEESEPVYTQYTQQGENANMHARSPPSERRREDRANGGHEQPLHRACSRPFHGPSPPVFFEREETVFERSRKHPSEEKECCPIGGSQILNVPLRRLKGLPLAINENVIQGHPDCDGGRGSAFPQTMPCPLLAWRRSPANATQASFEP